MSEAAQARNFGEKRERGATVSYLEIEAAAIDMLLGGQKPSIQSVRKALGDRGSPLTILSGLKRFWRDLGVKAKGDPAALTRLPIEIAEAVETVWQRALTLAAQGAASDENAARQHLERLRMANEMREQSLIAREKDYEIQAREREQALTDSRKHLLSALRMLESERQISESRARRIAVLELQVADFRRQLDLTLRLTKRRALRRPVKRAPQRPKASKTSPAKQRA
jgi:Plasmid replication region DNA-binding N-term